MPPFSKNWSHLHTLCLLGPRINPLTSLLQWIALERFSPYKNNIRSPQEISESYTLM